MSKCGKTGLRLATLPLLISVSLPALAEIPAQRTTQSDFGGVGLMQMPSARMPPEGSFSFNANRTSPYSRYSISVTPVPWMEGTLRYVAITNRRYGEEDFSGDQSLKDKSLDAKFRLWQESYWLPEVSVGFRDLAGTGLFSGEFIAASKRWFDLDFTLGIGWGYLAGTGDIASPLGAIDDRFKERKGSTVGEGGDFSFDSYFRGRASVFAGVEYQTPWDPLRLKLEFDGNDYQAEPQANNQPRDSRVNIGAVYQVTDGIALNAGWQRGNEPMIGISFTTNLKTGRGPDKSLDPAPEPRRLSPGVSGQQIDWADVSARLQDNAGFAVEHIEVRDDEVIVQGEQTRYRDEAIALNRAARVLDNSLGEGNYDWYTLVNSNYGMPMSEQSIRAEGLRDWEQNRADDAGLRRAMVHTETSTRGGERVHEEPLEPFDWGVSLGYVQNLGGPDGFILYQFLANFNAEYRFRRNSWVSGSIGVNLTNNFDKFEVDGPSALPRVRTDIRRYLTDSDEVLENLQYTYTHRYSRDIYAMGYFGLLENMFGGVGGEVLYRPFNSNIALGVDVNWVKQRGFKQDFSFRDYSTMTGHITSYWQTNFYNTLVKTSAGRYLAGDIGGTLEISRRFDNGVTIGAWATQTDVSSEDFGEGSFDKGIYFTFPFDAFFARSSLSEGTLDWRPLTRDGGAKLVRQYHLYDMTRTRDTDRFNDGFQFIGQ
ncbi:MAG: YjbH domain-containing protein [Gammaproteobacteria bacterium]|nr:YjbH domain-containing protein [Gammaproteobacteria bacterium]